MQGRSPCMYAVKIGDFKRVCLVTLCVTKTKFLLGEASVTILCFFCFYVVKPKKIYAVMRLHYPLRRILLFSYATLSVAYKNQLATPSMPIFVTTNF